MYIENETKITFGDLRAVCSFLFRKYSIAKPIDAIDLPDIMNAKGIFPYTAPEDVDTYEKARDRYKIERQEIVDNIKVTTTAGNLFDGDETSQTRMTRAIAGMLDGEVMTWVLADNTVIQAPKAELLEALRLAGRAQERVWIGE